MTDIEIITIGLPLIPDRYMMFYHNHLVLVEIYETTEPIRQIDEDEKDKKDKG